MIYSASQPDDDATVSPGFRNAGGSTTYRLREGIERFLITDINNPAESAKAQSSIFIMLDNYSSLASKFNYILCASNVLFMDGHVQFINLSEPVSPFYYYFGHHSKGGCINRCDKLNPLTDKLK